MMVDNPLITIKGIPSMEKHGTRPCQASTAAGCAECTQHKGPCTEQCIKVHKKWYCIEFDNWHWKEILSTNPFVVLRNLH